jgi:hypothetical protein
LLLTFDAVLCNPKEAVNFPQMLRPHVQPELTAQFSCSDLQSFPCLFTIEALVDCSFDMVRLAVAEEVERTGVLLASNAILWRNTRSLDQLKDLSSRQLERISCHCYCAWPVFQLQIAPLKLSENGEFELPYPEEAGLGSLCLSF